MGKNEVEHRQGTIKIYKTNPTEFALYIKC